jgi:transcriptional regulator with PAS, ATPase and Fis domain
LSKEYFAEHKEDYVNSLRKRRARVKSAEYLATVLSGKSVTIKSAVMRELLNINKSQIKIRRQETPMPLPSVTDRELQNVSRQVENKKLQNRILVEFNGESWTVGEFLIKLKQMPPLHRQTINFGESLSRHIIDMVRDELLLQEAYRQGIHKNKAVTAIVEKWRKELLADEFRKRILWVDYQKENPEKWQTRKTLYQALKTEIPVVVDTTILFHDVNENQLQQKVPALPTVIRDYYTW